MKQQLLFAVKFFTLTGAYLFTRSRTPANQRRNPEKAIAVLFLLENLKRLLLYNTNLIRGAKNQVEMLESDVNLFKAFLRDSAKIRHKNEKLEGLVRRIEDVVREAEDTMAVFRNQAAENRNLLQRGFGGLGRTIAVAKEVKAIRAKVKNLYDESTIVFAELQT